MSLFNKIVFLGQVDNIPYNLIIECARWHYLDEDLSEEELVKRIYLIEVYDYKTMIHYNDGRRPSVITKDDVDNYMKQMQA